MISLKRSMDLQDLTELRYRAFFGAYTKILSALGDAAKVLAGQDAQLFREQVEALRLELLPVPTPQLITQGSETLAKELAAFARALAGVRDAKESEYKQIVRILAETAASIAANGSSQREQLRRLATKIESVSRLEDVATIRKELAWRVTELNAFASRVADEVQGKAGALEAELRRVEQNLRAAETLAETDPLTGVGNRRMAERIIQTGMAGGAQFCLLLFDLTDFKSVNDRYGRAQGDQLLKTVARNIKNSVRESDAVCRWGGDGFAVLLVDTQLAGAEESAAQIQANAFGEFVLGHCLLVNLTARVGTVQYRPGETAAEFFERADQLLYEKKTLQES